MFSLDPQAWALFALAGAVAGFLAGLLGIGGGMIIVPALILSFIWQGVPADVLTHLAVGTSLASIMLTSISSVRTHHANQGVDWALLRRLAPALMLGSLLGAQIAHALPARVLQLVIAAFAIWTGTRMLSGRKADSGQRPLPGPAGLALSGSLIGAASAVFGIGGGSLMVPYLVGHGVLMRRAVGTAAACGFPIAVAGAAGFILSGWNEAGLPPGSTGSIYWPALLGISATSILCAHYGAMAAHRLPAATLKRAFGAVLILVGIRFLLGLH